MNHVVFYSGGSGSYEATRRLMETVDVSDIHLLFTDTGIEHKDLYRFLLQTFEKIYGVDLREGLKLVAELPELWDDKEGRVAMLGDIATLVMETAPNVHWLHYQYLGEFLTPWDIFQGQGFIGNSRVAPCSTIIKQRLAREYFKRTWSIEGTHVYFGIDWSEAHRMDAPTRNWSRYAQTVNFPLNEEPKTSSIARLQRIQADGIEVPELYERGFAHNNCGGFCVRGGQGHFLTLLHEQPDTFEYHASLEYELSNRLYQESGEQYSILTRQVRGVKQPLPLLQLKEEALNGGALDIWDIGGCGCFVTEGEEDVGVKFSLKDLTIFKGNTLIK